MWWQIDFCSVMPEWPRGDQCTVQTVLERDPTKLHQRPPPPLIVCDEHAVTARASGSKSCMGIGKINEHLKKTGNGNCTFFVKVCSYFLYIFLEKRGLGIAQVFSNFILMFCTSFRKNGGWELHNFCQHWFNILSLISQQKVVKSLHSVLLKTPSWQNVLFLKTFVGTDGRLSKVKVKIILGELISPGNFRCPTFLFGQRSIFLWCFQAFFVFLDHFLSPKCPFEVQKQANWLNWEARWGPKIPKNPTNFFFFQKHSKCVPICFVDVFEVFLRIFEIFFSHPTY